MVVSEEERSCFLDCVCGARPRFLAMYRLLVAREMETEKKEMGYRSAFSIFLHITGFKRGFGEFSITFVYDTYAGGCFTDDGSLCDLAAELSRFLVR
jgi:hypothetical protein